MLYVLHHDLTHLVHLEHLGRFWSSLRHVLPNCTELRRELRSLSPDNILFGVFTGFIMYKPKHT
ncbi:MAG TPA: DUF45 domain-containing protein [Dehalococcoidia bacterium]|nr:DUF45 domain-containing protein [Dehalococcoidia bacterium]HIO64392.1 DUF45 domain-containing protein [Dehalococcoidia bacterium]